MAKNSLAHQPEVFVSSAENSQLITRSLKRGEIRKVGPRLYTTNLADAPEAVIHRNLWPAIGLLFPGTVVSHRTALEGKPTPGGTVFLTGPYERRLQLPGLRVRQLQGPGPLHNDSRFIQSLWIASQARALLECLRLRRIRGAESPGLPRAALEERIEALVRRGEEGANALRDQARSIAPALEAEAAFEELDALVGALLGTRKAVLSSPTARARAAGEPYDPDRIDLFRILFEALAAWRVTPRPDRVTDGAGWANLAFFDAYFSNFIEGTEFEVEEALEIVFEGRIPRSRPQDAHDVLGTFRLAGSFDEMRQSAAALSGGFEELLAVLGRRHETVMGARPDKRPGEFKTEVNRAGLTVFVEPHLVRGTLRQGFDMLSAIGDPFKRAVFMMFLVSEVHPFDDGNGRVARIMMNAELISGGERRVLIPTSFREDYLLALRALSRQRNPQPLLRMLDRAQELSSRIDFSNLPQALAVLRSCHAFETDPDAVLRMPG